MSATRHWYPRYVRDFKAKTGHLTLAEKGAYCELTDHYWATNGAPLPADEKRLCRLIRAFPEEWAEVRKAVLAFFELTDKGWRHPDIDAAIVRENAGERHALPGRRDLTPEWQSIRQSIFKRDDYTCTYCGQRGGELQCDHVFPVALGGSDDRENLTTACKPCNQRKRALTPAQWEARLAEPS